MEPREVRRRARLPFGELESGSEIRMSREQFAFLRRWRREAVAPKSDMTQDRSEFGTSRQIGFEAGGEDDEIEDEGAGSGFDDGPFGAVANRCPGTTAMPGELIEPAAAPHTFLRGRDRKIFEDTTHKAPALQVAQVSEVTEQPCEIHPDERIDPGDVRPAEAKVNAR